MSENPGNSGNISFYQSNRDVVNKSNLTLDARYTRDLIACYLTIKNFYNLVFDEETNLVDDFNENFIREVLVKDTTKMIKTLKGHTGSERKGVDEAGTAMQEFLKNLYQVQILLSKTHQIGNFLDAWTNALILLQNTIYEAYGALEHLEDEVKNIVI